MPEIDPEVIDTLRAMSGAIDPELDPCPRCGGQLRAEVRTQMRSMAEVCAIFGVTENDVRLSGAVVDAFGRVKSGVPYVTCMHCGFDADASKDSYPSSPDSGSDQ